MVMISNRIIVFLLDKKLENVKAYDTQQINKKSILDMWVPQKRSLLVRLYYKEDVMGLTWQKSLVYGRH